MPKSTSMAVDVWMWSVGACMHVTVDVVVALRCVCSVCAHVCLCVWGLGTHATWLRSERSEDVMAGEAGSLGGKAASPGD